MNLRYASLMLATSLLSGNAIAADQLSSAQSPTPYNWKGVYAGVQAGYGWFKGEDNLGTPSSTLKSGLGGVYAGYNHLLGQFLLGVEAEANFMNFSSTTSAGFKTNIDWMIAGRMRAGYTFDRFLAYATTGVSASELTFKSDARGTKDSNVHTGFLLGAGLEGLITEQVSLRLEYQHHWFANQTYNLGGSDFKVDGDLDIIRAGISYHF
jgi:outer membrane immunogenic protein